MLDNNDMHSLRGQRITAPETRNRAGRQVLRLPLEGGGVIAIEARGDELHMCDESDESFDLERPSGT
jgi:hypothetical protein